MADQYFMKKGDRELGPFRLDDMRKMVRSGALGRFQNVSKDGGKSWAHASTFAEIWDMDLIPLPKSTAPDPVPPPVAPPPPTVSQAPLVVIPTGGALSRDLGESPPARGDGGLGLAGFITATTALVLMIGPLMIWILRYRDGYWAVPMSFLFLVAAVTGLTLSAIGLARRAGGFAKAGLVTGICASVLGLVTSIGWAVAQDPRDDWIVRVTSTAEADMQMARKNFGASLKRYREHAPKDDHAKALERVTKDLMTLTKTYKNLLQAAASTPRFYLHFTKLEDLRAAYMSFCEAVKLQDKVDAQEAIDRIGQSQLQLKELLDLWNLYQTGQLTVDSAQAKFRDY
jgi:hypothetical protein